MAITTSSGDRYDSLENFIGNSPNEYVKMEFDTLYGQATKPKQPVGPVDAPTSKGDWESEMITDSPPTDYMKPKDTMKEYKKGIENYRNSIERVDKLFPPVKEKGRVIIPGEQDYIRTKDLGKPVVYSENLGKGTFDDWQSWKTFIDKNSSTYRMFRNMEKGPVLIPKPNPAFEEFIKDNPKLDYYERDDMYLAISPKDPVTG